MLVHTAFDVLAALSSLTMTTFVYHWRLADAADRITRKGPGYLIALLVGAVLGAYGFGTLNLMLSGHPGIGRSIVGALAGAIAAVEVFKQATGMTGSTGLIFAPALAATIAVGRIGCLLSGLDDFTYGTETSLPWGVDFGDGVKRHPVQAYESAAMFAYLGLALWGLQRRQPFFMATGFYLFVGWYGLQRFVLEFLKPYGTVVGPLNVFHFVCAGLVAYAGVMMKGRHDRDRA